MVIFELKMLSIEDFRALIPDTDRLTDEEVAALRRDLYEMAELALECYFETNGSRFGKGRGNIQRSR